MRLVVRHQTVYRYSQPIAYATQTLRLTPRPYDGLSIVSWRVQGEGRAALRPFADGFGNLAVSYTHLDVYKRQLCHSPPSPSGEANQALIRAGQLARALQIIRQKDTPP